MKAIKSLFSKCFVFFKLKQTDLEFDEWQCIEQKKSPTNSEPRPDWYINHRWHI
jgi:hypothetical protein